jgi:16S rRNA U516 pseudouridylate synthase RsuA-like enzyme
LHRIRVGSVTLGDLPEGKFRRLTSEELEALR